MGFLDHSTNNIIVDAVLTDAGRRALARNDNSFQVAYFSLGDDEVDYQIIKHYGQTVGKEKIEKNTPVIEALTAGSLGLKHKLLSLNNEFVTHMPQFTITAGATDVSTSTPTFTRFSGDDTRTIIINVGRANGAPEVDNGLRDAGFRVEMNHLFLEISEDNPDVIYTDNIAVYDIQAGAGTGLVAVTSDFVLKMKTLTDTTFNIYSTAGGSYIRTFVKVTGINSGLSSTFEVRIQNEAQSGS